MNTELLTIPRNAIFDISDYIGETPNVTNIRHDYRLERATVSDYDDIIKFMTFETIIQYMERGKDRNKAITPQVILKAIFADKLLCIKCHDSIVGIAGYDLLSIGSFEVMIGDESVISESAAYSICIDPTTAAAIYHDPSSQVVKTIKSNIMPCYCGDIICIKEPWYPDNIASQEPEFLFQGDYDCTIEPYCSWQWHPAEKLLNPNARTILKVVNIEAEDAKSEYDCDVKEYTITCEKITFEQKSDIFAEERKKLVDVLFSAILAEMRSKGYGVISTSTAYLEMLSHFYLSEPPITIGTGKKRYIYSKISGGNEYKVKIRLSGFFSGNAEQCHEVCDNIKFFGPMTVAGGFLIEECCDEHQYERCLIRTTIQGTIYADTADNAVKKALYEVKKYNYFDSIEAERIF